MEPLHFVNDGPNICYGFAQKVVRLCGTNWYQAYRCTGGMSFDIEPVNNGALFPGLKAAKDAILAAAEAE